MRTQTLAAAIVTLLLAQPAPGAARSAAQTPPRAAPARLAQASQGMSAAEAAALVSARTGGRVLDVQTEDRGGALSYRVKVLLDGGRVRIVRVDAASGRMSQ